MPRLSAQQRQLLRLLQKKRRGQRLSEEQILRATGWTSSTFRTHLYKNAFAPFLEQISPGNYLVLLDGSEITDDLLHAAATQVRPIEIALHPGDRLSGSQSYELVAPLGAGAVGHVWKAIALESQCSVAVKVMLPRRDLLEPSKLSNIAVRFYREARNASQLYHPHLVRHLDHGFFKGNPFLVMELANRSLAQELRDKGRLSPEKSIPILLACISALEYLHNGGNVYRDIKPANILLCDRGYVLGDLGIVKWSDLNPAFTNAATITKASVQLGTWHYMAPEQLKSPHEAGPESDVYALGVTCLEILTGSTSNPAEIAAGAFPDPCSDPTLTDLIRRMVRYNRRHRPGLSRIRDALTKRELLASDPHPARSRTARSWLRENGYTDIADQIDKIMAKWNRAGKHTRRDWWEVLAGTKSGQPCTIEGCEFPVLKSAQLRLGRNVTANAIQRNKNEVIPPVVQTGRWRKKKTKPPRESS